MATEVVVDAGPLIHLAQAEALRLLDEFDSIVIPETVVQELSKVAVLDALEAVKHTVETVDHSDDDYPTLDPGETAAIILAATRDSILLTDDLAARKIANEQSIEVVGAF